MEILKEKKAELDSEQYGGVLFSLVKRNAIVVLIMLLSFVLCVALPLVAVAFIAFHRMCSCCKSWAMTEHSETVPEMRSRKKWTDAFYVLTVLMSVMTLGALVTCSHSSRASNGIVHQSHFLSSALQHS
ncbi:uncharacterized protein LOC119399002 [Rhipicephalus sanguineus]|uniref:uncharacterized protein LOC119399002 n=1 Tax=Rhipicephalus sanguineus TaxID=34632 RepID=UPI001896152D|nr:uncharacterized protein LOC119399002 [Rhipicephalus sanguineus]